MECLHCGDCCLRMSPCGDPITGDCPHLRQPEPGLYLCNDYENRPERCARHDFPSRFCPIGMDILGLTTPEAVAARIDHAFQLSGCAPVAQGGGKP